MKYGTPGIYRFNDNDAIQIQKPADVNVIARLVQGHCVARHGLGGDVGDLLELWWRGHCTSCATKGRLSRTRRAQA